MKSQKAKEIIEKYAVGNSRDAAPSMMKGRAVECVEIAEQEAEERMRKRAIEAYCQDCGCRVENECGIDSDSCIAFRTFIQKLSEK